MNCCRSIDSLDNRKSFNSSDNDIVIIERRYGCYRLGIIVALIIISLLVFGTVTPTLTIRNNKIILICLCISLVIAGILVYIYFEWQLRQARKQREKHGRPYVLQLHNQNGYYTSVPTSTSTRTSWLFWNTKRNTTTNAQRNPYISQPTAIQPNPTKISSLQQVSEAPQYTTIV